MVKPQYTPRNNIYKKGKSSPAQEVHVVEGNNPPRTKSWVGDQKFTPLGSTLEAAYDRLYTQRKFSPMAQTPEPAV